MAGISKFRCEVGRIDPIDIRLWATAEEMSIITSKRDGCYVTHDFTLGQTIHILNWNSYDFALASTNNKISIGKDAYNGYSQAEKSFDWSYSFIDGFIDIDFEDITSFGAAIDIAILVVDGCAGELSFYVTKVSV